MKKQAKIIFISTIMSYLIFSFCLAEGNPFAWNVLSRIWMVFFILLIDFILNIAESDL